MKSLFIAAILLAMLQSLRAQILTIETSPEIPESKNVYDADILDPGFANTYVLYTEGPSSKKTYLELIDSKTLSEKKKIVYPTFEGYDELKLLTYPARGFWSDKLVALNKKLGLFYVSKSGKEYAVSVLKLDEQLNSSEKPAYLFSLKEKDSIWFTANEKRDVCLFSYTVQNKKQKTITRYYRVYNGDLNLVRFDSLVSNSNDPLLLDVLPYDNGYAAVQYAGEAATISLFDLVKNKKMVLKLSKDNYRCLPRKIKVLDGKIILAGDYSYPKEKKLRGAGVFKVVYNPETGSLDQKAFFELDPVELPYVAEWRHRESGQICINETGICYFLSSIANCLSESWTTGDYELIRINNPSDMWKKKLPMWYIRREKDEVCMKIFKSGLYMIFTAKFKDYKKIDFNNYSPFDAETVGFSLNYAKDAVILKIDPKGTITSEVIEDFHFHQVTPVENEFLSIYKIWLPASLCKIVRFSIPGK